MVSRDKELGLHEACAGMVLARAVHDERGAVLLPAGAQLTDQVLASLERRGVARLRVEDDAFDEAALAAARAALEQRLAHLFRRPGGNRADAALRGALAAWRGEALE